VSRVCQKTVAVAVMAMAQQVPGESISKLYTNCISLEQKLREETKHKNFYEPDVRAVRMKLRLAYETLLFSDYTGSQVRFTYECQQHSRQSSSVAHMQSHTQAGEGGGASSVEVCVL